MFPWQQSGWRAYIACIWLVLLCVWRNRKSRECEIGAGSTWSQGFDIKILWVWDLMKVCEKKSQRWALIEDGWKWKKRTLHSICSLENGLAKVRFIVSRLQKELHTQISQDRIEIRWRVPCFTRWCPWTVSRTLSCKMWDNISRLACSRVKRSFPTISAPSSQHRSSHQFHKRPCTYHPASQDT